MITKEAIVLAGGLGTRLKGVLPDIPKCMAPVHGKPFLTYVLDYMINQKINKVILSVGYHKNQIINYFGSYYKSLGITYATEDVPLGTGGAVKLALKYSIQNHVYVVNGDTYFLPDLHAMENLHYQKSADITIAVKIMPDTNRYGLINTDAENRITEFREKEAFSGSGWINGGIYLIKKQVFNTIREQKFSFENDILKLSCKSLKMYAYKSDASFLDLGIPDDYAKVGNIIKATGNI